MKILHIHRFAETKDGTIGRMGKWCTLEEEDQNNQSNISSIPKGEYILRKRMYNTGGYMTYEVTGVPDRSLVLIHKGNTEEDTNGCILLGDTFGALIVEDEDTHRKTPKLAVLHSAIAFEEFMDFMDGDEEAKLVISGP